MSMRLSGRKCTCGSRWLVSVAPGHMAVGDSYGGPVAAVDTTEPSVPETALCLACWARVFGGPLRAEAVG